MNIEGTSVVDQWRKWSVWTQPTKNGLPWWLRGSRICLQCGWPQFDPWVWMTPWRRECLPIPVFLPVEVHGQRSLAGSSPWGLKESEATERLTHTTLRRLLWEHGSLVTQCRMLPWRTSMFGFGWKGKRTNIYWGRFRSDISELGSWICY